MKEVIEYLQAKRKIEHLVHFTPIENIADIILDGIIPTASLNKDKIIKTDKQRLDGHRERVCLSISFPNYLMKAAFKNRLKDEGHSGDFAVCLIPVDALSSFSVEDVWFYPQNAAAEIPRQVKYRLPDSTYQGLTGAKGMFSESVSSKTKGQPITYRRTKSTPCAFTTCPQAEVQVAGTIPPTRIEWIVLPTSALRDEMRDKFSSSPMRFVAQWKIRSIGTSISDWPKCWEEQRHEKEHDG